MTQPVITAGKNFNFQVGSGYTEIKDYVNEPALDRNMDMIGAVTGGGRSYVPGFENSTLDLSGPWSKGIDDIMAPILATETATPQNWRFFPAGTGSGVVRYSGTAHFVNWKISGTAEADRKWSCKMQILTIAREEV